MHMYICAFSLIKAKSSNSSNVIHVVTTGIHGFYPYNYLLSIRNDNLPLLIRNGQAPTFAFSVDAKTDIIQSVEEGTPGSPTNGSKIVISYDLHITEFKSLILFDFAAGLSDKDHVRLNAVFVLTYTNKIHVVSLFNNTLSLSLLLYILPIFISIQLQSSSFSACRKYRPSVHTAARSSVTTARPKVNI